MALAHSTAINELHILKDDLSAVPQVKQVFARTDSRTSLTVLVILDEYDRRAEKKIVEIESQFLDAYPWLDVDFDIVYLAGRSMADVVIPKGFQLFAR